MEPRLPASVSTGELMSIKRFRQSLSESDRRPEVQEVMGESANFHEFARKQR